MPEHGSHFTDGIGETAGFGLRKCEPRGVALHRTSGPVPGSAVQEILDKLYLLDYHKEKEYITNLISTELNNGI